MLCTKHRICVEQVLNSRWFLLSLLFVSPDPYEGGLLLQGVPLQEVELSYILGPAVYTLYKLKVHEAECQTLSLWVISYCAPTVYPVCVCVCVCVCCLVVSDSLQPHRPQPHQAPLSQ